MIDTASSRDNVYNKLHSNEIADKGDFTVADSIKDIKCYWEHLNSFATFFRYCIIQKHQIPTS